MEGLADAAPGPEVRYEASEAISLAFITALQMLPPRQRAVLILRDVLDFPAREVAHMLGTTGESVKSALKRARATLQRQLPPANKREPPPPRGSAAEQDLVDRLTRAYENGDVDGLVALLTEDVLMTMPPVPLEYLGRELVARFPRDPAGLTAARSPPTAPERRRDDTVRQQQAGQTGQRNAADEK